MNQLQISLSSMRYELDMEASGYEKISGKKPYSSNISATVSGSKKNGYISLRVSGYGNYRTFYITVTEATTDGNETTKLLAVVPQYDEAVDTTTTEVAVNKTQLTGYVSSINLMLEGSGGSHYAGAWPASVSQEAKDSGLLAEAQAVLDNENAAQDQVTKMENKINVFFTSHRTCNEELRTFPARVTKKNEADYTKSSWYLYKTYADLAAQAGAGGIADLATLYFKPTGEEGDVAWTKEQREIYALVDPKTGELYSTDPEDGQDVGMSIMMGAFSGMTNSTFAVQYNRFFDLEAALVSIKDLKVAVAEAEALTNDKDYSEASWTALTSALTRSKDHSGKT